MKLPPGISASDFASALQEYANVVGAQWVFSQEEDVALYNDAYTLFPNDPDKQNVASAAIAPESVEQIQQIVRIANKYKTPLHPISTGRNLGYGGASPNLSGAIILDLKRMNRILEINAREGYMIVEPGCSFIELQRYFELNDIPYVVSAPQPGWGSPIGNALDHGIGGTYGDNFSAVYGLEVVLANGDVLRTGRGALPTSSLWANYPYGFGPHITGMFSQSNFGIVTKACFWLKPKWEYSQAFTISSYSDSDWDEIIAALQVLANQEVIANFQIGSPIRQSTATNEGRTAFAPAEVAPEVKQLLRRRDGGTSAQWEQLAKRANLPVIRGGSGARGPEPIVKAKLEYVADYLRRNKVPGTFELLRPTGANARVPSIDFGSLSLNDTNLGHYYFSPIYKPTREDIFAVNETIRSVLLDAGDMELLDECGWWASRTQGTAGGGAQLKHLLLLLEIRTYGQPDVDTRRREIFMRLVRACGTKGWGEYRAPVVYHDEVAEQFSFGNHSLRRFLETMYAAVDPNGILAPGKCGIWPKHLRKEKV